MEMNSSHTKTYRAVIVVNDDGTRERTCPNCGGSLAGGIPLTETAGIVHCEFVLCQQRGELKKHHDARRAEVAAEKAASAAEMLTCCQCGKHNSRKDSLELDAGPVCIPPMFGGPGC